MEAKFSRWIKQVRDTQDEEINCSACLEQISDYVDLELATGDAARAMPQVRQHLNQCQVCREEYQVLRELARLEAVGDMPANDELSAQLKQPPKRPE
jgi:hypothetical protein